MTHIRDLGIGGQRNEKDRGVNNVGSVRRRMKNWKEKEKKSMARTAKLSEEDTLDRLVDRKRRKAVEENRSYCSFLC